MTGIFCLKGTQRVVVVSSEEAIRDVLIHKQNHFSDRPPSFRTDLMMPHDIAMADDSPKFRHIKKQMMQAIKQYGDGLQNLEAMTLSFGMEMLQEIECNGSRAFNPYGIFRVTIGSIIKALTYGSSPNTRDDVIRFSEVDQRFAAMMTPSGINILLDICPSLRFFSRKLTTGYNELIEVGNKFEEICGSFMNTRKANREMDTSKVFIDHFIDLVENVSNQNNAKNIRLSQKDAIFVGVDLLSAGMETSAYTLTNLLGILVNHPKIQDQTYEQISKAIGKRAPTIEDRQRIPYVEALILETLRYTGLTALSLPHYSSCNSELGGFFIPKGTLIFPNLWSLHHNEKYWENPFEFDPLRFLENGKLLPPDHIKKQRLLPFSAGRRQCPGEAFAKNRLFILVTLLLQKYKFLPAEGHPQPQHDPREYELGINNLIKPYKLTVQARD